MLANDFKLAVFPGQTAKFLCSYPQGLQICLVWILSWLEPVGSSPGSLASWWHGRYLSSCFAEVFVLGQCLSWNTATSFSLKQRDTAHQRCLSVKAMLMNANTELRGLETGGLHNSCTAADQLGSNCGQNRGKCSCKTPAPQQLPFFHCANGSPSTILDWNLVYLNRNIQQPNQGRGGNQPSSNNAHQVTTTTAITVTPVCWKYVFTHRNAVSRKSCLCHARNPNPHLNAADFFVSFWLTDTGSTAHGGGGSFKDSKFIGSVGFWVPWAAEQATDGSILIMVCCTVKRMMNLQVR